MVSELLDASEPAPYEVHRAGATAPQLVVCDHAARRIPRALNHLGLPTEHRASHIAQDLGAGQLALALSERLNATAVLCNYSRLVVDCNRALTDASAFLDLSDGVEVPGNLELSEEDKELRAAAIYRPYRGAIDRELDRLCSIVEAPVLIAIHSFTRFLDGEERRWDCGVLWDLDARIARPLLDGLRNDGTLLVGDNQPYSGRHPEDFTVDHHAEDRNFPYAAMEVRQDLLDTPAKLESMADRIHAALDPILSDPGLYTLRS
ncbi:MAG: N-formylglutamate amidohydrolase [Gammaproteobacteria bacterium]|nr:N-formylglutamate amidohydrolase [Gammaproteobacteria bacterium]